MIYLRQGEGCAEIVAAMDEGLFTHRIDLPALLALIENASRIALVLQRNSACSRPSSASSDLSSVK